MLLLPYWQEGLIFERRVCDSCCESDEPDLLFFLPSTATALIVFFCEHLIYVVRHCFLSLSLSLLFVRKHSHFLYSICAYRYI